MTAEEYFEQGKTLYEEGEYEGAEAAYKKAVELDERHVEAWVGLASAYWKIEKYEQAHKACQETISMDADHAFARYRLGTIHDDLKQYDQAIEAYQTAIQLDPKSAYSWKGLGNVYREQKQYGQAIEAFQTAIHLDPKSAYSWNGLGIIYREQKQYGQAIEAFQTAIQLDPKLAAPWNGLGNVYREQKQYSQAIEAYQTAIQLDPKSANPWHGLGNVYREQKQYGQAIEAFQTTSQLDPKLAAPWNGLGNLYMEQKQYGQAIEAYQTAIQLDSKSANPWHGLGNLYREQKHYSQAIEAYQTAIQLDPKSANPWHGLGNLYMEQKQYSQAIEAYQTAIQLDPKLALPWNGLGNVYWDQKQYGQAIEAFQTAIQLDPKLALPWNGLGNVYREQKAYSKAIEAFQAAIQLDPKFILSWHGLGIVYDMLQEGSKAGRCFLRAEALGQEAFAHNYFVAFSKLETHPFFSYRIIQSYMPPEDYAQWSRYIRITLENATPLKAYITWQSLRAEWGGLPEEKWRLWLGLIHYFMGDPSVALQYLNQSQAGRSGLSLMAAYYQVQACYDFFEPDEPYLQPALKQAETYLGPKPSFWKRLLSNTPRLDTEGILQCYYAGQIFVFNQEPEKALICFERIEKEYLPAAYMALQMCHELQYQKRKEQKVKALIKREARQQQFTKGLAATELNLDDPQFWKPFFHVAQYFELTEAIATFRFAASRAKYRKPPYVQNPKAQKYFHQLWKIRSEDWRRINARILEELNYRAFDQLFEEELQPKVKTAPKLSEAMIEERLDQYENAGLRSAFEHLRAMAVKGKAEQGLGELIKAGQFEPEQYQLLNAYFYSNGQLEDYERILLDFYILLQAEMKDGQLSKVQLAGVKKSADAVITDSLSYAIGFGASLMVPGLPAVVTAVGGVLGGYAIKMGAGALTELFMGFIQEEEPAFESYADFKEQFEGYIGERRRVLGEEGFYERYPVDELYNSH